MPEKKKRYAERNLVVPNYSKKAQGNCRRFKEGEEDPFLEKSRVNITTEDRREGDSVTGKK